MSEVKVSELPEASSVNDEDLVMIVQNNINKKATRGKVGNIAVSSTEPTTGEKVWLKTGKNLFDKNAGIVKGSFLTSNGGIGSDTNLFYQEKYIPVNPNTSYTMSATTGEPYRIAQYNSNKEFISRLLNDNSNKNYTFTTDANCHYIRVSSTISNLDSIQVEYGNTATTYENYIDKEILIKNNNNVYLPYFKIEDIDDKYYNPGDRYISSTNVSHEGFITGGGKEIYVTLKPPKRLDKVSSVAINTLKLNIRGISGYVGTSGADFKSYVSSAIIPSSKDAIVIVLTNSGGWGATNNTPVVVAGTSAIELTFS